MGELLIDFTCVSTDSDGYPTMAAHPGGAPATFLAALAKFGAKAGLIGKVGNDAFGKVLHYIQYFNADCKLRDRQGKRSLLIEKVTSIEKVYDILQMMKEG